MYKVHLRGAIKYSAIYLAVNNKSSCFCRYGTIYIVFPFGYWRFDILAFAAEIFSIEICIRCEWGLNYTVFFNLFVQSSHVQIIDWYIRHDLSISHDRNSGSITRYTQCIGSCENGRYLTCSSQTTFWQELAGSPSFLQLIKKQASNWEMAIASQLVMLPPEIFIGSQNELALVTASVPMLFQGVEKSDAVMLLVTEYKKRWMFGGVMSVIDDHFLKERTLWYG